MALDNLPVLSVSELAFSLKRTVEDAFGLVRVRGEITGCRGPASSGHLYFGLKDEQAVLDAVAWRSTVQRLSFRPEDGLEVVCTGKLTTYPGRSKYQIIVERMEPAGAGALMALLEERKRKLAAEGLFDAARKKPLPFLPEVVAVVTSPTGAVIRDILHRLADRFPRRVIVVPVLVQGEQAAAQVAAAIRRLDALPEGGRVPRPDVVIVARGGGSIEDLWAFNEEEVVRAAAACSIPLISAVGHETDTTLIDLAADVRAPTPTAAAEMAVPVRADLAARLDGLRARLGDGLRRLFREQAVHLEKAARGLPDPRAILLLRQQRLDDLGERLRLRTPVVVLREQVQRLEARAARLRELVADRLAACGKDLAQAGTRLDPGTMRALVERAHGVLAERAGRLEPAVARLVAARRERLDGLAKLLDSLGYRQVLARGFALVRKAGESTLVPTAAAARALTELDLVFADGEVRVQRGSGRAERPRPAAPRQESLW
jgi:exodeoxyribonuclease VII large subunit